MNILLAIIRTIGRISIVVTAITFCLLGMYSEFGVETPFMEYFLYFFRENMKIFILIAIVASIYALAIAATTALKKMGVKKIVRLE